MAGRNAGCFGYSCFMIGLEAGGRWPILGSGGDRTRTATGRCRMASVSDWKVPASVQPKPGDYAYDLESALSAVVGVRAVVPPDAFTADTLGTERAGNGVLIRADGLVLTIGYLITEAET